jgi:hypothetical protein
MVPFISFHGVTSNIRHHPVRLKLEGVVDGGRNYSGEF